MHIEPGLIPETKIVLSYATASAAGAYAFWQAAKEARQSGVGLLLARSLIATAFVFVFFEVLPHFSAGVSEVHFIFGSTIFLLLGTAPAAFGLALGLLLQGLLMAPADLPQYAANVTTLLVPLFAVSALAKQVIARETRYVDISYKQMISLSAVYQAGIVSWVVFWVLYGNGVAVESFESLAHFSLAYLPVILIEPLADVALLWVAKTMHAMPGSSILQPRLNQAG